MVIIEAIVEPIFNSQVIIGILIMIIAILTIILIGRDLRLKYWKIDKIVNLLEDINKKLDKQKD